MYPHIDIFYVDVTLEFERLQYQVFENQTTVEVCVDLRGNTTIDIAADIDLVPGGSAGQDTDFQFSSGVLSFMANGIPRSCHKIIVSEDGIIEDDENILLAISTFFSRVFIGVPGTEIVIRDSTTSPIEYLNATEIAITEGSSVSLCFRIALQLERNINIRIEFSDFTEGNTSSTVAYACMQFL